MKCVIFLVTAVGLLLAASSLLPTDMSTTRANKSASWFVSPSPVGDDLSGDGTWDKPFATIQKAIDIAASGDQVILGTGVYSGDGNRDLVFRGKDLTVRSLSGARETILDAGGSDTAQHRAFYLEGGLDTTTYIEGLTITGGYSSSGGGVWCKGASPTFVNCVFTRNTGTISGGAVRCKGSSPHFINCTFFANHSDSVGSSVFCLASSSPVFKRCLIAFSTGAEAIACLDGTCQPRLQCSDVYGNAGGDWVDCIAHQSQTDGNLSLDPTFCLRDEGDLRLRTNSPCLAQFSPCGLLIGALGDGCQATSVTELEHQVPLDQLRLAQNYPNPFNPSTRIEFAVPSATHVNISVFNLQGQTVANLVNQELPAGRYGLSWDGCYPDGSPAPSGVYFYRMRAGLEVESRKMVLLR